MCSPSQARTSWDTCAPFDHERFAACWVTQAAGEVGGDPGEIRAAPPVLDHGHLLPRSPARGCSTVRRGHGWSGSGFALLGIAHSVPGRPDRPDRGVADDRTRHRDRRRDRRRAGHLRSRPSCDQSASPEPTAGVRPFIAGSEHCRRRARRRPAGSAEIAARRTCNGSARLARYPQTVHVGWRRVVAR